MHKALVVTILNLSRSIGETDKTTTRNTVDIAGDNHIAIVVALLNLDSREDEYAKNTSNSQSLLLRIGDRTINGYVDVVYIVCKVGVAYNARQTSEEGCVSAVVDNELTSCLAVYQRTIVDATCNSTAVVVVGRGD